MMCRCFMDTLTIACLLLCTAFPLICGQTVRGIEGQSVTLPCSYKVNKNNDITSMCWGRGSCPNSKCNEALIWTDGHSVTHRSSNRYRLEDAISRGIVSLTISQASMSDAGVYCCRIEHAGWFNDEKKNIRLYINPAPTTTPPTTTRRTKAIKTTPPPTTPKTTVPSETTVSATTLLPTPDKMSTSSSTTSRSITTIPTDEEPIEMTTVPTAKPTTQPTTTDVLTSQPTTLHTTSNYTTLVDETTSQKQFLSTDQFVTISHEIIQPDEAFNHHRPRSTLPSQAEGQSGEKGFSDLISGNVTTMEKKESGFPLHILVIAICVALVIMAAVAVLILKFRGKARGHYPFGLDPNLELVSHAENPLSEVEISQTVTLEVAKVDSGKPALWDQGTTSKTDD